MGTEKQPSKIPRTGEYLVLQDGRTSVKIESVDRQQELIEVTIHGSPQFIPFKNIE
jgi:hypothetical protein